MKKLLFLFFLIPIFGSSQNTLNVAVDGVTSSKGNISVAVYNQEDGFLQFEKVYKSDSTLAKKGRTELSIKNLPEGEYALAIFHDENDNHILDLNWLGVPKEPVGFSNAKMKTFGPPTFIECAFHLDSDSDIRIIL